MARAAVCQCVLNLSILLTLYHVDSIIHDIEHTIPHIADSEGLGYRIVCSNVTKLSSRSRACQLSNFEQKIIDFSTSSAQPLSLTDEGCNLTSVLGLRYINDHCILEGKRQEKDGMEPDGKCSFGIYIYVVRLLSRQSWSKSDNTTIRREPTGQ